MSNMSCMRFTATALSMLCFSACKSEQATLTCVEMVTVSVRDGQKVVQAINGVYLKNGFPLSSCEAKPGNGESYKKNLVQSGYEQVFWKDDRFIDANEYGALKRAGKWPSAPVPSVEIYIAFGEAEAASGRALAPSWWYQPSIPHRHYPIDLLPNFALDAPDPEAGVGPVRSKPTVYWAVRGTLSAKTGRPYTTSCSLKPPSNWDNKNFADEATKARDVAWLVKAETYAASHVGNACRGHARADNGKSVSAMVDVPGAALKDIDKIYRAVSKRLSEMTVD